MPRTGLDNRLTESVFEADRPGGQNSLQNQFEDEDD